MNKKVSSESVFKDIRRRTRKKYSSEEKIRIVLDGLRGEDSISSLCRREGIPANLYYRWSKDFLEAGKKRLMGDTTREASSHEVVDLKKENEHLKQLVAAKVAPATSDKFGYSDNDRGGANLSLWKSSNFTTVPITLGPNDSNDSLNGTDGGRTGLPQRGGMGRTKATLVSQPFFSRGDSIGDISGLVKITNTGATPVTVICN